MASDITKRLGHPAQLSQGYHRVADLLSRISDLSPVERRELIHEIKHLRTADTRNVSELPTFKIIPSNIAHLLHLGASIERVLSKSELETIRRAADEVRIRIAIVSMLADDQLSADRKLDNLRNLLDHPDDRLPPFTLSHFPGEIVCSSVDRTSIVLLPHIFTDSDVQPLIEGMELMFRSTGSSVCWIIDFSLVRAVSSSVVAFLEQRSIAISTEGGRVMLAWVHDGSLRGTSGSIMKQHFQLVKVGAFWFSANSSQDTLPV
jgi:hypothetical protein